MLVLKGLVGLHVLWAFCINGIMRRADCVRAKSQPGVRTGIFLGGRRGQGFSCLSQCH